MAASPSAAGAPEAGDRPPAEAGASGAGARQGSAVPGAGRGSHLAVAGVLALLTIAAFTLTARGGLGYRALAPVVLAMAGVQAVVQVLFSMHLRQNDRLITLFFVAAGVLGVFIAWIVWYLLVLR